MFGPFRSTTPSLGGLLWKIPWKLSQPQKARHRKRLQHVDRVVSVLDSALQSQSQASTLRSLTSETFSPSTAPQILGLSPSEATQTIQGQRLLAAERDRSILALRNGRGPKQGDLIRDHGDETLALRDQPLPESSSEHEMESFQRLRLLSDRAKRLGTFKLIERWKADMPSEPEMLPKDKYTIFDRKARGYRKGVHKLPKWTRVSQRVNPPGF